MCGPVCVYVCVAIRVASGWTSLICFPAACSSVVSGVRLRRRKPPNSPTKQHIRSNNKKQVQESRTCTQTHHTPCLILVVSRSKWKNEGGPSASLCPQMASETGSNFSQLLDSKRMCAGLILSQSVEVSQSARRVNITQTNHTATLI